MVGCLCQSLATRSTGSSFNGSLLHHGVQTSARQALPDGLLQCWLTVARWLAGREQWPGGEYFGILLWCRHLWAPTLPRADFVRRGWNPSDISRAAVSSRFGRLQWDPVYRMEQVTVFSKHGLYSARSVEGAVNARWGIG